MPHNFPHANAKRNSLKFLRFLHINASDLVQGFDVCNIYQFFISVGNSYNCIKKGNGGHKNGILSRINK